MGATIVVREDSPYLWVEWGWFYESPTDLRNPNLAQCKRSLTMLCCKASDWPAFIGQPVTWEGSGFQVWHRERGRHYILPTMKDALRENPNSAIQTEVAETKDIPRPKETRTHSAEWRSSKNRWEKRRKSDREIYDWDCTHPDE